MTESRKQNLKKISWNSPVCGTIAPDATTGDSVLHRAIGQVTVRRPYCSQGIRFRTIDPLIYANLSTSPVGSPGKSARIFREMSEIRGV